MQTRRHRFEKDGEFFRYRYRGVTALGGGLNTAAYCNMSSALKLIQKLQQQWPTMEVQRIREFIAEDPHTSWKDPDDIPVLRCEYEVKRKSRWVSVERAAEIDACL